MINEHTSSANVFCSSGQPLHGVDVLCVHGVHVLCVHGVDVLCVHGVDVLCVTVSPLPLSARAGLHGFLLAQLNVVTVTNESIHKLSRMNHAQRTDRQFPLIL